MSKTIDFHKTSNMAIEINEMYCFACESVFYELDGHELDDCPKCGQNFENYQPDCNDGDDDTYLLIVDPVTGVPAVVRRDGEPVLAPKEGAEQ
ncbi:hypothetical protein [Paenibacillus sp. PAMC 26794]|uniref:hypothetical protein n=1 Tax=Paenibacillus sp. PAMC 26794 TaxID=1257080 RepID=UPI0002FD95FE|nr:hypothetical protein [Paenibacillus sp. PAMC 26794]